MRFLMLFLLQSFFLPSAAASQTVVIDASADNTLYEDAEGDLANGSGAILLAGRTNAEFDNIRRAVLFFDVSGELPHGAIVEAVTLRLYLERGNGGGRDVRVHRMLADWGEGDSTVNGGGLGAPAEPGDATWLHSFYPDGYWGRDGGRYVGRVSAVQRIGNGIGDETDMPGTYVWESTDRLVDDVRRWLRRPATNYGWILVGDESAPQTVKRFFSRESVEPDLRPRLEVTYSLPE
jgi:hypothetical protein